VISRGPLDFFLKDLPLHDDGIYRGLIADNRSQNTEIEMRQNFANQEIDDYFSLIQKSHSVPVMDFEVRRFLREMPSEAIILDIGGCWGWHWRQIKEVRPDVRILIVDFVLQNLIHAKKILGDLVGKEVFLVHADATNLPFLSADSIGIGFDGVWTVQTLQHIPDFKSAVSELFRVLGPKGLFINYSLNIQPHMQFIYKLLKKKYHISGILNGEYFLDRASSSQKLVIESQFNSEVTERWTEFLFSPELLFFRPGIQSSVLGMLDTRFSNNIGFLKSLARQHSFECRKN